MGDEEREKTRTPFPSPVSEGEPLLLRWHIEKIAQQRQSLRTRWKRMQSAMREKSLGHIDG
jgi:hypothetical protein